MAEENNNNNAPPAPPSASPQPYQAVEPYPSVQPYHSVQPYPLPKPSILPPFQHTAQVTPAAKDPTLNDPAERKQFRGEGLEDKRLKTKKLPSHIPGFYGGYDPNRGLGPGFRGPGGYSGGYSDQGVKSVEKHVGQTRPSDDAESSQTNVDEAGVQGDHSGCQQYQKSQQRKTDTDPKKHATGKAEKGGGRSPRIRNLKKKVSSLGKKR